MVPDGFCKRLARAVKLASAGLSPRGYLGSELVLGALVLVAAGWLFGGITEDVVTGDPLTQVDLVVADWFASHALPDLTQAMLTISGVHGPIPMTAMVCGFGLFLVWQRKWHWFIAFLIAVPGGILLNALAKEASGSVGTMLRISPLAVVVVIPFLIRAQLALGACDISEDRGERFAMVITAVLTIWNVGIAFVVGSAVYLATRRGWIKL